ncbi:hypothetical protein [Aquimarina sp. 2201CG5-10]|uniref:hypothetical protein n=1 Tax=Aquimarina callyspongiae TaxID=3098150 RepID=UPI002AB4F298|nr:hypothetical protein [Aquimarina sp. 2201CG5-10]MDY8138718.1 hypothetical protein [Aquimarina sp. 2201CG5-10]
MSKIHLVPPDAVRVWRGFRSPSLKISDFFERLSTVFVPATVEMQTKIGLASYIPTIPGGVENKPDTVPDETAILYWNSQDTYHDGFKTLAVRTYTLTHGSVYTSDSRADFPTFFKGTLQENEPCYLVDQPADWMNGNVNHIVGGKPPGMTSTEFAEKVASIVSQIQKEGKIDGGVVCVGPDYLVYWELGETLSSGYAELQALIDWKLCVNPKPTSLPKGLWEVWPGMDIKPGDGFNMQFKRNDHE